MGVLAPDLNPFVEIYHGDVDGRILRDAAPHRGGVFVRQSVKRAAGPITNRGRRTISRCA